MSDQGYIKQSVENGVGSIEFFHPKSNALPSNLLKDLAAEINKADANDGVKVILLKSGGERAFCAGASFDELLSIDSSEKGQAFFSGFAGVILAIKNASKFVVTQIQGKTVGGGVGIACASDYVIATEAASLKLSELSIGIGPFVIGPAVERKMGVAAFGNMSINATDWMSAQWALDQGVYGQVVSGQDELNQVSASLIEKLSSYSPQAMKEIKAMLWKGTEHWEEEMKMRAEQSGRLVLSDFTKETLAAFKNKG